MPTPSSYDYAIVRVVPRVEREEFINAGVILSCPAQDFLGARILLHLRGEAVRAKPSRFERAAMRLAAWTFASRRRFVLAQRVGRIVQRPLVRAGALSPWTRTRDLKPVARESFRDWWRRERS